MLIGSCRTELNSCYSLRSYILKEWTNVFMAIICNVVLGCACSHECHGSSENFGLWTHSFRHEKISGFFCSPLQ